MNKDKLPDMIAQIENIIDQAKKLELRFKDQLEKVHPLFHESARNLIHYRAMRSIDLRALQMELGQMGLSRLAKAEGHVMASLLVSRGILRALLENEPAKFQEADFTFEQSHAWAKKNRKRLLGDRTMGRRTRIMVTLPSEAAENYTLVHHMLENGMNCARINCAHDSPEVWKRMIDHVRSAADTLERECKIAMDLGGPKIRTGALVPGPRVKKYRPQKDIRGYVIKPLSVWLGPTPNPDSAIPHVPISLKEIKELKDGDVLYFKDARNKKRQFVISQIEEEGCFGTCSQTIFLETGIFLFRDPKRQSQLIQVGEIPPLEVPILLNIGDMLRVHGNPDAGEPTAMDEEGNLVQIAHISCTAPEVFQQIKVGDPVLFDDGKIESIIREVNEKEMLVEIVHAQEGGGKLRSDKGINFPESALTISGLTEKDRQDLEFVAAHADVVNMSFVNRPEDVEELLGELDRLDARERMGIILKIETQSGFNNLTPILLEAMQVYPLGVMIARGDLAIECGWDNIGRVQKEILSFCQAGHITDIWATQVLENLAKRGIPSRAEITDAAMAQRADCVMLNKGIYILNAIRLLDTILKDLEPYQDKNAPLSPAIKRAGLQHKVF